MKKPKTVKPFFFKDHTHDQMNDLINDGYAISLKYNEDLVDRIAARYPLISKTEISIIVKYIFESIRELMVLGNVLNFNNLFFDTKLHFFSKRNKRHIIPALKVKISTPPPMRKHD